MMIRLPDTPDDGELSTMNATAGSGGDPIAPARQLIAANEQLVVAALQAQSAADTARHALKDLARAFESDALTELPNRQALLTRFTYSIAIAKRAGTQLALLFVDLNNFKTVNDTLGHGVGDQVLRLVAKRLVAAVRETDTVSRHGGDEFLILLTDVTQASDAGHVATKLLSALALPAQIGEHAFRLTASIGISLFPDDGEDTEKLIHRADDAMYRAKRHRDGAFAFYVDTTSGQDQSGPTAAPNPQFPPSEHRAALAEQTRRHTRLRGANERLILAMVSAQQLQDAAEAAQRRQTDLLTVIAHEQGKSLADLQHAVALLDPVRCDEAELAQVRATIARQAAHMACLVSDLRDVSLGGPYKPRLERRMIDLLEVIYAAVVASRPGRDARQQHLAMQLPRVAIDVYGDRDSLTQIFTTLLDNASKHSAERSDIALSAVHAENLVNITVSDPGIGLSPEALRTIFEPIAQVSSAAESNDPGLGIGLSAVRELISAHQGDIVARSLGVGSGTLFIVSLPRVGESSKPDSKSTGRGGKGD